MRSYNKPCELNQVFTKIAFSWYEFWCSVSGWSAASFQMGTHSSFWLGAQSKINKLQLLVLIQQKIFLCQKKKQLSLTTFDLLGKIGNPPVSNLDVQILCYECMQRQQQFVWRSVVLHLPSIDLFQLRRFQYNCRNKLVNKNRQVGYLCSRRVLHQGSTRAP